MRILLLTISILLSSLLTYGQNIIERTFREAINDGFSTAPVFVVLTVTDGSTTNEIVTDVSMLFEAVKLDRNEQSYENIQSYLLDNSATREIQLKNNNALKMIGFYDYKFNSEAELTELLNSESIIDSLKEITSFRELLMERFYVYSDQREAMVEQISDSISNQRNLTKEEHKMLEDLDDQYYDYHYNEYAKISNSGKQLMMIWNAKIEPHKMLYKQVTDELARRENKFFRDYFTKYGWYFVHVAFKHGAIFNRNDESGELEFIRVIAE